jgi:antitoxin HicB
MSALGYIVTLETDDNGTVFGTCPAMPEVSLFGENPGDALIHAIGALEEALARRIADWTEIPPMIDWTDVPKGALFVPLPLMTSLKIQLYQILRANNVSRADLVRALHWHREQVDRLFRLDHMSRLDQIEAAAKAAGGEIEARIHSAA